MDLPDRPHRNAHRQCPHPACTIDHFNDNGKPMDPRQARVNEEPDAEGPVDKAATCDVERERERERAAVEDEHAEKRARERPVFVMNAMRRSQAGLPPTYGAPGPLAPGWYYQPYPMPSYGLPQDPYGTGGYSSYGYGNWQQATRAQHGALLGPFPFAPPPYWPFSYPVAPHSFTPYGAYVPVQPPCDLSPPDAQPPLPADSAARPKPDSDAKEAVDPNSGIVAPPPTRNPSAT